MSYLIRLPIIEQSVYIECIPVVSQMCVWGSMYFFILVMKRFKDKLLAQDYKETQKGQRWNRILTYLIFIPFTLCITLPELTVNILIFLEENENQTILLWVCMGIRGLARLFVDTYMYTQFILIFRFFVRTKEAQLQSQNKEMPLQSIVVIYFVYLLFIFNVLYRLCSMFFWSYYKLR